MFYSHDVLTSRKHGVATIWLVATLGSKSSLKKISRKAILDVDVPGACETIADPDSPMALRLQSSLLYGVSRVFSQQCGYILTDTQSLRDKMKGISMVLRDLQIDGSLALTSNDQLNLPLDPSFNLDLDLGFDFSVLSTSSQQTQQSSLLSPRSLPSTQSSLQGGEDALPQLDLPSSRSLGEDFLDLGVSSDAGASSIRRPLQYAGVQSDEPGIEEHPIFEINDDGELVDIPMNQTVAGAVTGGTVSQFYRTGGTDNEGQAYNGLAALADIEQLTGTDFDDGIVLVGDDDEIPASLPDPLGLTSPALDVAFEHAVPHVSSTTPRTGDDESEATAEAPQRPRRPPRPLQIDQITELNNKQLSEWQATYLDTMAQAKIEIAAKRSVVQARRNAAFWILEQGLGGASINFGSDRAVHPLSVFSGHALIEALTGTQLIVAGRKRSHSDIHSEHDDDHAARRARGESERNIGRGEAALVVVEGDDGMLLQGGDDDDLELEVGRQPASSLKDHPSSMPWNLLGSSLGGSLRGSAQPGISSSIRGLGIDVGPPSGLSGRRSRLTSASPLVGRGRPLPRLGSLDPQRDRMSAGLDDDDFGDPYAVISGYSDDVFELYGPAAVVSSQQAAQSQWLASALENEAQNFLAFLDGRIASKAKGTEGDPGMTFEELLPANENSDVVAAQGFLHVLTLATKGLVNVRQDEAFGEIYMSIVEDEENESVGEEMEAT